MADSLLINLNAAASVAATDLLYATVDPSGTPLDKKATVTVLATAISGIFFTGTTLQFIRGDGSIGDIDTGMILTVPTVDGTANGVTSNSFNCGYTSSAVGDLVYLDSSATWQKTDANSVYAGLLGIALEVKASGAALNVALGPTYVYATAFPSLTVGGTCFMGETPGAIVQTAPVTSGAAVRVIGYAVHADKILFNPSGDYFNNA